MKKHFSILFLIFSFYSIFGQYQINLKTGSYSDLKGLLSNNPNHVTKFRIVQRSEFDIKMAAGNDFKIKTDSIKLKKSIINSKTYAIYDGKDLYLNGKFINGFKFYCRVENNKRFLIVKAGIPKILKRKKLGYDFRMVKVNYVPIGGFVGGGINGAQLAMVRLYYIVDCKTGSVKILTKDYLNDVLKDYPDLKAEFDLEKEVLNQSVLLKYIIRLNDKLNNEG